jgi:hypothetical protein
MKQKRFSKKGGVKLKTPWVKHLDFAILNSPGTTLDVISVSSANGFVIKLTLSNEMYSVANGLSSEMRFTVPVMDYALKIFVIHNEDDTILPRAFLYKADGKQYKKFSMKSQDAIDECSMQQQVWSNSIIGGRPELCPSVINLSLFENNDGKQFLMHLHHLFSANSLVDDILNYLWNILNITVVNTSDNKSFRFNFGLGIITMPLLKNSHPLHSILKSNTRSEESKIQDIAKVIAQLVRLFIFFMVIHLDAHSGNSMVANDQAYLIDFGNSSYFGNDINDAFFDKNRKKEIRSKVEEFQNNFFEISFPKPKRNQGVVYNSQEGEKINFIRSVLNYMISLDIEANSRVFPGFQKNRYQLEWLNFENREENVYKNLNFHFNIFNEADPRVHRMLYISFNMLKQIQSRGDNRLPRETIQSLFRQGYFLNFFNQSVRDFIVATRRPQQEPPPQNQAVDMIDSDVESDTMETPKQTTDQQPEEMNTSGGRKLKRKTRRRKRFTKRKFT